jgi:hypothetical protein
LFQYYKKAGLDPDYYTTGGKYGKDVAERMKMLNRLLPVQMPELLVEHARPKRSLASVLIFIGLGVVSVSTLPLHNER